jgi:hypothetical protein
LSPESPAVPDVGVKPGDPTIPAVVGAKAEGLTNVGAEEIPEITAALTPVPCTKTLVGVGDDVGDIDGDKDPEWCLTRW